MLISIVRELEPPSPAGVTLHLSVVLSADGVHALWMRVVLVIVW